MKAFDASLNGAWEEPGVIGTRVEICNNKIAVLWRNSPVLTTSFSAHESDGRILLTLKKTGLRYNENNSDYAEITSVVYENDTLALSKRFPISGDSTEILKRTSNSRFGNFTVDNGVLKELKGTWKSGDGFITLDFCRDTLSINGKKRKICALKPSGSSDSGNSYIIADADPSRFELDGLSRLKYDGRSLTSDIRVCDAPSVKLVFSKENRS